MKGYIKSNSQEGRILALLRDHGDQGVMVYELVGPKPEGLGIAQYNARIYGLRKKGYVITNVTPGHFILVETEATRPKHYELDPVTLVARLV